MFEVLVSANLQSKVAQEMFLEKLNQLCENFSHSDETLKIRPVLSDGYVIESDDNNELFSWSIFDDLSLALDEAKTVVTDEDYSSCTVHKLLAVKQIVRKTVIEEIDY